MIEYNGQAFENNPNSLSPAVQFEGRVHLKYKDATCISVYGFNETQVIETAKQFAKIEPNVGTVEIYGPENIWAPRSYLNTYIL